MKRKTEAERRQAIFERYNIDDIDKTLLKYQVQFPAASIRDLAALIGYSTGGTHKRINRPAYQATLSEINKSSEELIKASQNRAVRKLTTLLDSADEKIALDAAKALTAPLLNKSKVDMDINGQVTFSTRIGTDGAIEKQITKGAVPVAASSLPPGVPAPALEDDDEEEDWQDWPEPPKENPDANDDPS